MAFLRSKPTEVVSVVREWALQFLSGQFWRGGDHSTLGAAVCSAQSLALVPRQSSSLQNAQSPLRSASDACRAQPQRSLSINHRVRFAAKSGHCSAWSSCPLCANSGHSAMRRKTSLFDHLVSAGQYRRRNGDAERLSGFKIDDQFKFDWLLHRQLTRVLIP